MKQSIAIILSACVACLSCFGGTTAAAETEVGKSETPSAEVSVPAEKTAESNSLYTHGLEVISLLSEMLQTEYPELLTSSDDILSVIQNILDDDFSTPKSVYSISLEENALSAIEELNHLEDSSDALKSYYMQKVLVSLINRANAMGGSAILAAAGVCTVGSLFVDESAEKNVIYLYIYDNAVPVAVAFSVGEDHAVSANGMFILYEDFACGSIEDLEEFFNYIPVEIEEVQTPDSEI